MCQLKKNNFHLTVSLLKSYIVVEYHKMRNISALISYIAKYSTLCSGAVNP